MNIIPATYAQELSNTMEHITPTVQELIHSNQITFTLVSAGILFVLTFLSIIFTKKSEAVKPVLFFTIIAVIVLNTFYLASSTVYMNSISSTGGPVHWHADFLIYGCGKEYELIDPQGLSNKVGTSVFHEHNDKRIHLEGVVVEEYEASLGYFFKVVGGKLTSSEFMIPTPDGEVTFKNGDICPDGRQGTLQVFVYKTDQENKIFTQEKLTNPASYVLSPYSAVPPGDCIVIEFDELKERTDKLCEQYQLKVMKGELHGT